MRSLSESTWSRLAAAVLACWAAHALASCAVRDAGGGEGPASPAPASLSTLPEPLAGSVHLSLGTPRSLRARGPSEYLVDEGEFALSYNTERRAANWVAWKLAASDLGSVERRTPFHPDTHLPEAFRATPRDYTRSGYDRGHLCPSADRTASREANAATFGLGNVLPQVHELNAGPWERLESYSRLRARSERMVLYIVAGGLFEDDAPRIGHGVAVPYATFKIIAELREGETASDVTASSRVAAVLMPNQPGVGAHPWEDFLTSVDRVEEASGYDFLPAIPDDVEMVVEARLGSL